MNSIRLPRRVRFALAGLALTGSALLAPAYATQPLLLPPGPGDWTPFRPGPVEIDGRTYTPSCSQLPGVPSPLPGGGAADTATFQFWAKRGTVNKLVVYFEGGGGCWDARTCLGATPAGPAQPTFVPYSIYHDPRDVGTAANQFSGMFDLADTRNPFRDWHFVYVPYCTGDIHAGSAVQPVPLPTPTGPLTIPVHHRGHDNFRAVLKFMTDNFDKPAPRKIFVSGASGGGYGALLNMPWIADAFPAARIDVLADASQGITTPAWDAVRDAAWNFQVAPWIAHGEPSPMPPERIFRRTFEYYPDVDFGQYTHAWDATQIFFLDLMADPSNPTPGICTQWHDRMQAGLAHNQGLRNFHSYVAHGNDHTITRSPRFYTDDSAGVPFLKWVSALVRPEAGSRTGRNGAWSNVACTGDCGALPPPVCPF